MEIKIKISVELMELIQNEVDELNTELQELIIFSIIEHVEPLASILEIPEISTNFFYVN